MCLGSGRGVLRGRRVLDDHSIDVFEAVNSLKLDNNLFCEVNLQSEVNAASHCYKVNK
jgi:hypothetical protein